MKLSVKENSYLQKQKACFSTKCEILLGQPLYEIDSSVRWQRHCSLLTKTSLKESKPFENSTLDDISFHLSTNLFCLILINIWEELTFNFVGLGNWKNLEFKTRSLSVSGHNFQYIWSILEPKAILMNS